MKDCEQPPGAWPAAISTMARFGARSESDCISPETYCSRNGLSTGIVIIARKPGLFSA